MNSYEFFKIGSDGRSVSIDQVQNEFFISISNADEGSRKTTKMLSADERYRLGIALLSTLPDTSIETF